MEGNGKMDLLTAEELTAAGRIIVQLSSGRAVRIRRLGKEALAMLMVGIPDLSSLATAKVDGTEISIPRVADGEALEHKLIVKAVLEPELSLDPKLGATPADFTTTEQDELLAAIMEHSGWTKRKAEEVLPLSSPSA